MKCVLLVMLNPLFAVNFMNYNHKFATFMLYYSGFVSDCSKDKNEVYRVSSINICPCHMRTAIDMAML